MTDLVCRPLTKDRWGEFEQLFDRYGACGGRWCMLWRSTRKTFEARKGAGNRRAMKRLVDAGRQPGLLAYRGDEPVGWCALAPRKDYPSLGRSRILKPVDDTPCWSVSCLFVRRDCRRQGVSIRLLEAAVDHARKRGAGMLEGYPVEPKTDKPIPAAFAWTGIPSAYERAGFVEVARRSPTRPIMRVEP